MTIQRNLGDHDQAWDDIQAIDDARLARYSQTGRYDSLSTTASLERARRYLSRFPPSISGSNGRRTIWSCALALVHDFALHPNEAFPLLSNHPAQPPWSVQELQALLWRAHRYSLKRHDRGHALNRPPPKR